MLQIVGNGLTVEVVDDQPLTAGSGTLHFHHGIADIDSYDAPLLRLLGSLGGLPRQLTVLDKRRNVNSRFAAIYQHFVQTCILTVFLGSLQVKLFHFLARKGLVNEEHFTCRLLNRHPRTAKGPARTRGHVKFYAVLLTLALGVAQHLHPLI